MLNAQNPMFGKKYLTESWIDRYRLIQMVLLEASVDCTESDAWISFYGIDAVSLVATPTKINSLYFFPEAP